jgi:uncharacterized protein
MKYLLVAVVVLVAIWWLRAKISAQDRSDNKPPTSPRKNFAGPAEAMLACRHCGVHVAASECVTGRLGSYCSEPHRLADESS